MEHSEDGVIDADIHINYHTKEIKFENKVMGRNPILGWIRLFFIFVGALALMIFYSGYTTPYPRTIYDMSTGKPTIYNTVWDYYLPGLIPMFGVVIFFISLIAFIDLWSSGSVPWLRDRMLDGRRKRAHNLIEIPDPSGTITYRFIGSSSPLIDMEYNDDIADALVESSLVKETEEGKYLKRIKYTRSYMVLKISLSRPAKGTLKIIEY